MDLSHCRQNWQECETALRGRHADLNSRMHPGRTRHSPRAGLYSEGRRAASSVGVISGLLEPSTRLNTSRECPMRVLFASAAHYAQRSKSTGDYRCTPTAQITSGGRTQANPLFSITPAMGPVMVYEVYCAERRL
jgi:hypothetical protein